MKHPAPHVFAQIEKLSSEKRAELEQHCAACADCRAKRARIEMARVGLSDMKRAEPPEIGGPRVEAALRWARVESKAAPARRPLFIGLGFAVACAGLLVMWQHRALRPAPAARPAEVAHAVKKAEPVNPSLKGMVTELAGRVTLTRDGHTSPVEMRTLIQVADRVTTAQKSRVAVEWGQDSGALAYADSELSFDRFDAHGQNLGLAHGKVAVRVGPHPPNESLEVKTPAHLIRVHGTWFTVAAQASRTDVEVIEGTVEVIELDGGASTMLHAPVRASFGRGRITSSTLAAREVAAIRSQAELNLLPWRGLDLGLSTSGTLNVDAGDVNVAVDGLSLGASPLAIRRPQGKHYIELTRAGYAPVLKWITIGPEPGELRTALIPTPEPERGDPRAAAEELEKMAALRARFIRGCYERSLKRDPSLAGTVTLKLQTGRAGQVQHVSVEESTLSDPAVAECLKHETQGWSFHAGKNATLVYPFVFRAQ